MSHLGRWPQLGKSLGQCDGQLKAQHRLHARDDNPRFGQELIDLGFDGRGLFRILCHRRFLSFGEPGHRVPAQHGQAKEYGRGHDRDPNGGHALHGDERIERQGQGDRQERRAGEERGKNQDSATVLPTLDDAVLHGWGNQQRKRDHEEGQARAHKQPGYVGQKRELLLEYAIELETEKDLRAEDQQATFIERDLKLAFKLHGPGVIVPAWHPSLDCEVLPTGANARCARPVPRSRNRRVALCVEERSFIPSTEGEDGDPVDVLVMHDAATAPGLVLKCKIGVLEVLQSEKGKKRLRNDRLIAVPRDSHREHADKDARDLPKPVRKEIEKFFVATDELEDKDLQFLGWKGPKTGERLIDKTAKQFRKGNGKS